MKTSDKVTVAIGLPVIIAFLAYSFFVTAPAHMGSGSVVTTGKEPVWKYRQQPVAVATESPADQKLREAGFNPGKTHKVSVAVAQTTPSN